MTLSNICFYFLQGTTALEILEDLPQVDAVFVTVGGGALISGMAAYIKTHRPSCKVSKGLTIFSIPH